MDCHQVESQLAMLSAEALPATTAHQIREHLTRCKSCEQEWQVLQSTLLVLSTTTQPLLSQRQSEQLWRRCSEQLHEQIEAKRLAAQKPSWLSWINNQPRLGWAALGSAVAVFGGVWWFSPQDAANSTPDMASVQMAQGYPDQSLLPPPNANEAFPGRLITFQRPSAMAASMVDNHTAMTFDPFIDYVATTAISSSAAESRAITRPVSTTSVGTTAMPLP